jgi:hypothetical protein
MPDIPQPATIQDARAGGATTGTLLSAPLAPATGPIDVPEPVAAKGGTPGAEPMVVVVVKKFWQSATIKALRNAVGVAVGAALLVVALQVVSVSGDVAQINWQTTQKAAIGAAAFSIAAAYAAWWKSRDNNPVK